VLRPVAIDGPIVSIRKFPTKPHDLAKLIEFGALPPDMAQLLAATVKARITLIVSGGTGTGKTTLLNALSASISAKERLVTIEDAAEFQLQQPHVIPTALKIDLCPLACGD
jgi:pilus assembly protein CpaF